MPLALINLTNRIEPNWDLTIVKVTTTRSPWSRCLSHHICCEGMPLHRRHQPYQPHRASSKLRPQLDSSRYISPTVREIFFQNYIGVNRCPLSYYQVIMLMDIFQYSNMYTLRKSIQWLAGEEHIIKECGPYVTKPGAPGPLF